MKISVILPYYNGGAYIQEQLDSILRQLGRSDEVIISVDRATDGSMDLLREYEKKDRRIFLSRGPGRGVVRNVEHAIKLSSGDIIFLSDQDDVWLDGKVKKVMEIFSNPAVVAVVHNAEIVDENLKKQNFTTFEWRKSRTGAVKNFMKNSYIGACMAFRSALNPYIFPIPEKVYMHDYWIGRRAEELGRVEFLREPLLLYRRHSNNVTGLKHGSVLFMLKKRFYLIVETIKWKFKQRGEKKWQKE